MQNSILLLISVCITAFMSPFMGQTLSVAVDNIATDLQVQPQMITYVISGFMIASASFLLPASAIANRFGIKKTYAIGSILVSCISTIVAFSPNLIFLIASRAIQGLAYGLIFSTSMALLISNVAKEKKGFYIGINVAFVYLGLMLSPLLGGFITDFLGWRYVFYFGTIMQLISFTCILKIKQDKAISNNFPFIPVSLAFTGVSLSLISLTNLKDSSYFIILLIIGLILLISFFIKEKKSTQPLLPLTDLIYTRSLRFELYSSFYNYMATCAITLLLSMHLQLLQGYSASSTGIILCVSPVFMIIFSILSGKLCNKINDHIMIVLGCLFSTLSLGLYALLDKNSDIHLIIGIQIISGIGFGLYSPSNTHAIMNSILPDKYSVISALQAITRNVGMATGIAFLNLIFVHFIDVKKTDPLYIDELSYSLFIAFICFTLISILGLIFSLRSYFDSCKHIT